ncbi:MULTISPECIES: alpha-amylase family glycosyl hydrolase [unclassified Flavobacterium]|uniref:alpha-amylase family glycosyl hydrolase n=1 Tax=unclassified Flavobacterium TaxID=196869 RepID=UPI001F143295|nr:MULTISPECIES: alpha-amylase family glycosyl hydrolase [unclassified Flavobacterium]UMY65229.1 alpha-amylase family glycosyl hydrolase [Flavobacterium sp. HJ-32-4]
MKRLVLAGMTLCLLACQQKTENGSAPESDYTPKEYVQVKHPEWAQAATIYEVNVRQYTKEGTFRAFESHLPRLKKMGIDIIWLMPVHPIGVEKRKGTLGSYYSIIDFYGVNPEFGTKEDFKHLVKAVHDKGMHLIIDWVANHSSWDNPLAKEHPDWYTKTPEGHFQPTPWYDWDDVIDFDYDNAGLRKYMTDVMVYWVRDMGIDGFRCDTAGFVPVDFWDNVRARLDAIKPVFMLGEWESRDLHAKAFDMTYAWSLWDKMVAVTRDGKPVGGIVEYLAHDVSTFPRDAYRMTFTDNHDKNSWEGNPYKNFGEALDAAIVLTGTVNGMPLVYSGQEAGLDRSLAFFEKDEITWKDDPHAALFRTLFDLKHRNKALWNGKAGGVMIRIFNNKPDQVISFSRTSGNDQVISIINFSKLPAEVTLDSNYQKGSYKELFSGATVELKGDDVFSLPAWGYKVLVKP